MLSAPAKLTLSLRITGVRPDGYHELESEMVTVDLADTLQFAPGDGLVVTAELPGRESDPTIAGEPRQVIDGVPTGEENLVVRALAAVGRRASVRLTKRIPPGAGLGGGSADAAAVLRWAGESEAPTAAGLGADVPFCVHGGRAMVRGIGEAVEPLPFEDRAFVLCLLPFAVDTAAVYSAWDALDRGSAPEDAVGGNDLEAAALVVAPRLRPWKRQLEALTGRQPKLAGSGSTWFFEGTLETLGLGERRTTVLDGEVAVLVPARTVAGFADQMAGEHGAVPGEHGAVPGPPIADAH